MTIEGEKDDITGRGQTAAAHALCPDLPGRMKFHWEQKEVGHYGVFNGSRFRASIRPRMEAFIDEHRDEAGKEATARAATPLRLVPEEAGPRAKAAPPRGPRPRPVAM